MKLFKTKKSIISVCKLLAFIILLNSLSAVFGIKAAGKMDDSKLHAICACLYDATNERVLYSKNGDEVRAMASTTKIMTCILALEYGNLDDIVTVSKYAASMPDVQLNAKENEQYRLGDLLYSLMLESHNDVAVIIAEHISGSVLEFSKLMNDKARDLCCFDTYFITPNGLDGSINKDGKTLKYSTTATDLAKIMAYCIKNPKFLEITTTKSYTFNTKATNADGLVVDSTRSFTVTNKNAFLDMMEGVISGKTGFTGDAGYCYVCAFKKDGKTFVVTLLGCGWPNNKTYKWQDSKYLLNYGLDNYESKTINEKNWFTYNQYY